MTETKHRTRCLARVLLLTLAVLAAGLLVVPAAPASAQDQPTADELMRRMDRLWRGDSSYARMRMTVQTQHYERTMEMASWSEGLENALVRIEAPRKDAGVTTLRVGDNMWNYLPKINRVTKVPPSMMSSAWMGSHFTNDDLVRESSFEEDYASEITFAGTRDGRAVYEITSTPRPDVPVVWGRLVSLIAQEGLMPLAVDYYDEDGELVRTMRFSEVQAMDGRRLPTVLTVEPQDKPQEFTRVVYEELRFNVDLPPDLFSLRRLQSR